MTALVAERFEQKKLRLVAIEEKQYVRNIVDNTKGTIKAKAIAIKILTNLVAKIVVNAIGLKELQFDEQGAAPTPTAGKTMRATRIDSSGCSERQKDTEISKAKTKVTTQIALTHSLIDHSSQLPNASEPVLRLLATFWQMQVACLPRYAPAGQQT